MYTLDILQLYFRRLTRRSGLTAISRLTTVSQQFAHAAHGASPVVGVGSHGALPFGHHYRRAYRTILLRLDWTALSSRLAVLRQ